MPRYYCDYCDTYLTHDSPSVRKQHNAGYKHKANVREYYKQFEEQQTQSLIDQRIKEHLGQTGAFQQVGGAYNQHMMGQRPRLPILPAPMMPMQMPGNPNLPPGAQLMPGMRPALLPRPGMPPGAPGYMHIPGMPPMNMMAPPGAPNIPGQVNGAPRPPPPGMVPASVPGSAPMQTPPGPPPSLAPPPNYQPHNQAPASGGFDSYNNANQPAPEANH